MVPLHLLPLPHHRTTFRRMTSPRRLTRSDVQKSSTHKKNQKLEMSKMLRCSNFQRLRPQLLPDHSQQRLRNVDCKKGWVERWAACGTVHWFVQPAVCLHRPLAMVRGVWGLRNPNSYLQEQSSLRSESERYHRSVWTHACACVAHIGSSQKLIGAT